MLRLCYDCVCACSSVVCSSPVCLAYSLLWFGVRIVVRILYHWDFTIHSCIAGELTEAGIANEMSLANNRSSVFSQL